MSNVDNVVHLVHVIQEHCCILFYVMMGQLHMVFFNRLVFHAMHITMTYYPCLVYFFTFNSYSRLFIFNLRNWIIAYYPTSNTLKTNLLGSVFHSTSSSLVMSSLTIYIFFFFLFSFLIFLLCRGSWKKIVYSSNFYFQNINFIIFLVFLRKTSRVYILFSLL